MPNCGEPRHVGIWPAGDQYAGLDRFGRIVDQRWTDGTTDVDRYQYGYDRAGNRTYRENTVNSALSEVYSYDGLSQLTGFERGTLNGNKDGITGTVARSQEWDYDALGNWNSVTTDSGSPETRSHNRQNEITAISGATTPTYDANGNLTRDETGKLYSYDPWNRLLRVREVGGSPILAEYNYDALGRRVIDDGVARVYSANWQVLEERSGTQTTNRYIWSPVYVDAMVARDRDTDANGTLDERLYPTHDANFNVTALLNTYGAVVERMTYDPFGKLEVRDAAWAIETGSSVAWIHLHQGGRLDVLTGLYHFRNREYSPTLGRWVTMDPLYPRTGSNAYQGLSNNALRFMDPLGLADIEWYVSLNTPTPYWIDLIEPSRGYRIAAAGFEANFICECRGGKYIPDFDGQPVKYKEIEDTTLRDSMRPNLITVNHTSSRTNFDSQLHVELTVEITRLGVSLQAYLGVGGAAGVGGYLIDGNDKTRGASAEYIMRALIVMGIVAMTESRYVALYSANWTVSCDSNGKVVVKMNGKDGSVGFTGGISRVGKPHWEDDQVYAKKQATTPGDQVPPRR